MNQGIEVFSRSIVEINQTLYFANAIRKFEIGLKQYGTGDSLLSPLRQLTDQMNVPGIFWFVARYTFENFIYEIGYGDRELIVASVLVFPKFDNYVTSPAYFLQALGESNERETIFPADFHEGISLRVHAELAELGRNFDLFSLVNQRTIDRIKEVIAEKEIIEAERQRKIDQTFASEKARKLFHAKEYARFLETIKKYRDSIDLEPSIKGMISYCHKKGFKD